MQKEKKIGHAFPPDSYLQLELEASFMYEDTPIKVMATDEVKGIWRIADQWIV